ncbi:MAG: putative RiPP precursor [Rhodobacterales bacterium]|nr:putative RiPP precursor [Rhodobacterales bacterium]
MKSESTAKLAYETPVLECHGSMETLTQGTSSGTLIDAVFPRGTPLGELTFS